VETEATVVNAGVWDTLTFDFSNQAPGTAAINFSYTYDMLSIFYNFGTDGATAGSKTYYCDDVFFGGSSGGPTTRNVTFQVDLSQYTGGPYTQVNLNGTFNGWCGSCAVMTDANNDSIYEITVAVSTDTIEYKFTLDGWTVDEQFAGGEPCTKTVGGFTNRFLAPSGDTTLQAVCWESCAPCGGAVPTRNVTFQVDLSTYSGSYTEVNLNGTFNGWCGSCAVMTDANNDSIYELTVTVPADTIEYKFTLDGWTVDEQFAGGEPCTKTDGGFTNRYLAPTGDTTLIAVCWESCDPCDIGLNERVWVDLSVAPNPTTGIVNITGNLSWDTEYQLIVTDITGRTLMNIERKNNQILERLDLSQFDNGTYLITILGESGKLTERLILQR
jgi:hypothetical protein